MSERTLNPFDVSAYMLEASDYVSRLHSTEMLLLLALQRIENKRADHAKGDIEAALRGIRQSFEVRDAWGKRREEALAAQRERDREGFRQLARAARAVS